MHTVTRLQMLRFDPVSRRYTGDIALTRADGTERTVRATVLGNPGWPLERVARMLIGAARMRAA
ncbi:MAG: hypothetical protein OEM24_10705 [Paracoccaceae bacterium]|nr:hypothetical protein [Paracoccaceae bacterium]